MLPVAGRVAQDVQTVCSRSRAAGRDKSRAVPVPETLPIPNLIHHGLTSGRHKFGGLPTPSTLALLDLAHFWSLQAQKPRPHQASSFAAIQARGLSSVDWITAYLQSSLDNHTIYVFVAQLTYFQPCRPSKINDSKEQNKSVK